MDAVEEPSLPPTAEAECDEDAETEEASKDADTEQSSRKGSESTVVECKIIHEQPVEVSLPAKSLSIDPSESEESSEYEDATSHTSRDREVSAVMNTPISKEDEPASCVQFSADPPFLMESPTLADVLEETTSEDRIHMWLEDSQTSMSDVKEQDPEDASANQENISDS